MTQTAFGAGALWGNRTDTTGSGIGPDQFGILQDVSIDFNFEEKPLYGAYEFPVDIGRGKGKITGKAKFAEFSAAVYGDLFFGQTATAGMTTVAENEAATIPASTPWTVTVVNAATYVDDLGVSYASGANAGTRFTRVTTPTTAGQYSVNLTTGVYTFDTADSSAAVNISYLYTNATTGKTITITNQLMGVAPVFKATFYTVRTNVNGVTTNMSLVLNRCMSSQLTFASRNDDFEIPDFTFSAFADGSNTVGTLSLTE